MNPFSALSVEVAHDSSDEAEGDPITEQIEIITSNDATELTTEHSNEPAEESDIGFQTVMRHRHHRQAISTRALETDVEGKRTAKEGQAQHLKTDKKHRRRHRRQEPEPTESDVEAEARMADMTRRQKEDFQWERNSIKRCRAEGLVLPEPYTPTSFYVSKDRNFSQDFGMMMLTVPVTEVEEGDDRYHPLQAVKVLKQDKVLSALKMRVRDYNSRSIETFAIRLSVKPTLDTGCETMSTEPKFFTFSRPGNIPHIVPMRRTGSIFEVRIEDQWLSLEEWYAKLLESPSSARDIASKRVGKSGYNMQWRWWVANGKSFPFLGLSAEVRVAIYEACFGPVIMPKHHIVHSQGTDGKHSPFFQMKLPTEKDYWNDGELLKDDHWSKTHIGRLAVPAIDILHLSQGVRSEALQVAWEATEKRFCRLSDFSLHLDQSHTLPFNELRQLQLDFDLSDWFQFFGVRMPELAHGPYFGLAEVLPSLAGLRHLDMFFHSTKNSIHTDPCSGWFSREPNNWYDFTPTTCHRLGVDWALAFGFHYLKDIPSVHIEGFVKDSVKIKWQLALVDYHENGNVPESDLNTLELLGDRHLTCICSMPCKFDIAYYIARNQSSRHASIWSRRFNEKDMDMYKFEFHD